ncbi:hypothetical protein [Natronomonas moolapensis]|uniref:hypothetical protein n=1 Tax=Natronomonas moolapensis TaxID=416273 RepID=UPI000677FDB3|nr:hypothetical protein [Natronomonas moolapensis]
MAVSFWILVAFASPPVSSRPVLGVRALSAHGDGDGGRAPGDGGRRDGAHQPPEGAVRIGAVAAGGDAIGVVSVGIQEGGFGGAASLDGALDPRSSVAARDRARPISRSARRAEPIRSSSSSNTPPSPVPAFSGVGTLETIIGHSTLDDAYARASAGSGGPQSTPSSSNSSRSRTIEETTTSQ